MVDHNPFIGLRVRTNAQIGRGNMIRLGDTIIVHPDDFKRIFDYEGVKVSKFSELVRKAKVVLTAAPTYLVIASTVVTAFSEEIGSAFPGVSDEVAVVAGPALAAIGAAIAIVRRVSPVPPEGRGL